MRHTRHTRIGSSLALVLAVILVGIAIWIVVPAPSPLLLGVGVGAPELCPWLLALALLVGGIAAVDARTHLTSRAAAVLAGVAALLASLPLVQFAGVARRSEAAMTAALGDGYWDRVPAPHRASMRPTALIVHELFTGLRPGAVRVTRNVPFAVVEGEPLALDVYRPTPDGKYPTIVQIYGGAWQRGTPGDNALFARELAARGFTVFAIDYRHAPRWRWPAQLADVRAALHWIRRHATQYDADITHLALLGRSAGAHLAMLAAYEPSEPATPPVQAVVNYYGPVDLIDGYRHPPHPDPLNVRQVEVTLFGAPPDELLETYRTASPIAYTMRTLPPTLSIYGGRDHIVEPRYGALLDRRLRATGTTSVFLQIPWAEHAFDAIPNGPSAQLALYHTERFLAWALSLPR